MISISFVKYSFYSLILFLSPLNCLSEYSCRSLNFFYNIYLNFLSVGFQSSMTLSLIAIELSLLLGNLIVCKESEVM